MMFLRLAHAADDGRPSVGSNRFLITGRSDEAYLWRGLTSICADAIPNNEITIHSPGRDIKT